MTDDEYEDDGDDSLAELMDLLSDVSGMASGLVDGHRDWTGPPASPKVIKILQKIDEWAMDASGELDLLRQEMGLREHI